MLTEKLYPKRFPGMSGKMAAIVGCVLEQHWTEPEIAELVITSDSFVLARRDGDCGCNDIIGSAEDLERNVRNLLAVAGLTPDERQEWDKLYLVKVMDWRRNGCPAKEGIA